MKDKTLVIVALVASSFVIGWLGVVIWMVFDLVGIL